MARYLGNLVAASSGELDVFIEAPATKNWRPAIWFIRSLKTRGYATVLISHLLPLGTAAWIARFFGGPRYAVLIHGLDLRLAMASPRKAWLARRVLRGAKAVIANSEFTRQEIETFDPHLKPIVLTPGAEPMLLPDRVIARTSLGIRNDEFIILSVCRLVARKGVDHLIEALASLPVNARLVVVGDGPDLSRLQELARLANGRVTFIQNTTDDERNAWYASADIFALPIREEGKDVEGFGIVFLEAAQAGLPVVAGKSGGVHEAVVDQKTGLLVDPNDVAAIAQALNQLIHDQGLRARLGEAGKTRVEKDFQWKDRWERLRSILSTGHAEIGASQNKPLVSIVIPVYNHAPEALTCLKSLERQTYQPFEVIIADDGSTDDLATRISQIRSQIAFPFIFVRFTENRGAPAARNEGFKHVAGKYVLFLDADIELVPTAIEKMVSCLEADPNVDFAYGSFRLGWKRFVYEPFDSAKIKRRNDIPTTSLVRRDKFPGSDESLKKFQDWDVWLTMIERGSRGKWLGEIIFAAKVHRGGMSQWFPKFMYKIPWPIWGYTPKRIRRYREAEAIIRKKHGL